MYLLARLQRQCESYQCRMDHGLSVRIKYHYNCNSFLGKPYARSICSIFPLCME